MAPGCLMLFCTEVGEKSRSTNNVLCSGVYPCVTLAILMSCMSYDAGRCRRIAYIDPVYELEVGSAFYVNFDLNSDRTQILT